MKIVVSLALSLLCAATASAAVISPLTGTTENPQWKYLGSNPSNPEWFSRYSSQLDSATLQAFKNAPGNASGVDLYASSSTVQITYLGTGATRDSNLFLAYGGSGSFDTAAFWAPVYASGGSNNLGSYNPVTSSNSLFSTRDGCAFAQAKAGNTCLASQLGMAREVSDLELGDRLVFGLQALPLVYNAGGSNINLPNTGYFFSGSASNNGDARGWADGQLHTKSIQLGDDEYLVGFEDTWLGHGSSSDRDYNDMVFLFKGVSTSPVPEPESLALLVPGLALVAMAARRRRQRG